MFDLLHPQKSGGVQLFRHCFLLVVWCVHVRTVPHVFGRVHVFGVDVHRFRQSPFKVSGNKRYRLFERAKSGRRVCAAPSPSKQRHLGAPKHQKPRNSRYRLFAVEFGRVGLKIYFHAGGQ